MKNVAAVAFTPAPTSDSPNLKSSSDDKALATFHRLLELCFASIRRWNPSTTLVLVTTSDPGQRLRARLDSLSVQILQTEFAHRPPVGFYPSFNASLFSIDALEALATQFDDDDRIMLLDPDVICTRPLDEVFANIPADGFLAYDTNFPADQVSQGLSAVGAGDLHQQLDSTLTTVPRHYGGELYGFKKLSWDAIAGRVDEAWKFSLAQWEKGLPRFVTEEHLLNYALRHTQIRSAQDHIRRIWTAPTHRTVERGDVDLPIWHLPAEKHRGLARLSELPLDQSSWFWQGDPQDWQSKAARVCGVSYRRPITRWLRDSVGSAARRTQARLRRS